MQLIPPDNQDAGRGRPAERGHDSHVEEAARRVLRRRFTIDVSRGTATTVVTLGGELDVVCADAFRRRFAEATEGEPSHVVIDLRDLTFIDSTGLALLLRVNEMSRNDGFSLSVVTSEESAPSKIFRMTGADRILPIVDAPPETIA
jgi:anti-sigma B factor antagonist